MILKHLIKLNIFYAIPRHTNLFKKYKKNKHPSTNLGTNLNNINVHDQKEEKNRRKERKTDSSREFITIHSRSSMTGSFQCTRSSRLIIWLHPICTHVVRAFSCAYTRAVSVPSTRRFERQRTIRIVGEAVLIGRSLERRRDQRPTMGGTLGDTVLQGSEPSGNERELLSRPR